MLIEVSLGIVLIAIMLTALSSAKLIIAAQTTEAPELRKRIISIAGFYLANIIMMFIGGVLIFTEFIQGLLLYPSGTALIAAIFTYYFTNLWLFNSRDGSVSAVSSAQLVKEAALARDGKEEFAHNMNNAFAMMNIYLETASDDQIEESVRQSSIEKAKDCLLLCATTTSHLFKNSVKGEKNLTDIASFEAPSVIEVHSVMDRLFPELIDTAQHYNIRIVSSSQCPYLPIRVPDHSLKHIVINIVKNAVEAIKDSEISDGLISITLDLEETKADLRGPTAEIGPYAVIEIADNGPGMNHKRICEIVEKGFSTKVYGSGLGLWSVQRHIESIDGASFVINSEVAVGTRVSLRFPVDVEALESERIRTRWGERQKAVEHSFLNEFRLNPQNYPAVSAQVDQLLNSVKAELDSKSVIFSLITDEIVYPVRKVGLETVPASTQVSQSFCQYLVHTENGELYIPDLTRSSKVSGYPMVNVDGGFRSYAGIALYDSLQINTGALCAMGDKPKVLTRAQKRRLKSAAQSIVDIIHTAQELYPLYPGVAEKQNNIIANRKITCVDYRNSSEKNDASVLSADDSGRTIGLVVDDERALCDLAAQFLNSFGMQTIRCYNASEAMKQIEEHSSKIALLFTDVVMPGEMDGIQLADYVAKNYPEIQVVMATGYSDRLHKMSAKTPPVLFKPYRKKDLQQVVASLNLSAT